MEESLSKTFYLGPVTLLVKAVPLVTLNKEPKCFVSLNVGDVVVHGLHMGVPPDEAIVCAEHLFGTWDKFNTYMKRLHETLVREDNGLRLKDHFLKKQINTIRGVLSLG